MAIHLQHRILKGILCIPFCLCFNLIAATNRTTHTTVIDRSVYEDKLSGFWLGQSLANWTGLITEMDKIGGPGSHGKFYTRDDWGKPDQPSIWGQGIPSELSPTIDWLIIPPGKAWGADDDTDIEFMYQYLLSQHQTTRLTPEQIRDGWLTHIYSDTDTPFKTQQGEPENYLWVSNQRAFDLMQSGMLPPETGMAENNPHFDMIDAQLTTEIFGLFAPGRPEVGRQLAQLPIQTTASGNAQWIAEFYVTMYSLAALEPTDMTQSERILWMASQARMVLPEDSYAADMYDFVLSRYQQQIPWETVRDQLYQRYQVEQQGNYDITSRELYCNGCFAAGINFASSLVSLFYGEGDYKNTVKLAVLMGWDADNPAATWGGMLGFMMGMQALEAAFSEPMSKEFNIHRTRRGFAADGVYRFSEMAAMGIGIIDRVVEEELDGRIDRQNNLWLIPTNLRN